MNATAPSNSKINKLFTALEFATKGADHFNFQSLYHADADRRAVYDKLHGEDLETIAKLQKQIVRALFKTGQDGIGEVEALVQCGTLPKFAIKAAFNRLFK